MTEVPNQYRRALKAELPSATARGDRIRSAFTAANAAMVAGAWTSTKATAFGKELAERHRAMFRAGDAETGELNTEITAQPETVPENSWQANWNRLSRMEFE